MKILVLQLARFGDIFLSWPALRALRRINPEAEIHLLVRERFAAATEGLGAGIVVHKLPATKILGPLTGETPSLETAQFALDEWVDGLAQTPWDRIINLSFSPSSSYLTDVLANPGTQVNGYTRHTDGFLAIPDDASAYFYAQVGPAKQNRIHLVDLFSMVVNVELAESDWSERQAQTQSTSATTADVVVHLGASQTEKVYSPEAWAKVVAGLAATGRRVTLIGSADERRLAEGLDTIPGVENKIGKTKIPELFPLIKAANLLIGADSAPVHIAALVGTPVLNVSFDAVSFWETGPISIGSVVLRASTPDQLNPETVIETATAILSKQKLPPTVVHAQAASAGPRFHAPTTEQQDFCWNLVQALYTQNDFPRVPEHAATQAGVQRLIDTCNLAEEQFHVLEKNPRARSATGILENIDIMLKGIAALAPVLGPLLGWFDTERLRIPPGEFKATFERTANLFRDLATISRALQRPQDPLLDELRTQGLRRLEALQSELPGCAKAFRFFEMAEAEPKLQSLLDHLSFFEDNGLHHVGGTKVSVVEDWTRSYGEYREILSRMIHAFEKRDYLVVADALEYEITACLQEWRAQLVKWQIDMLP